MILLAPAAFAFTLASPVSDGCHERFVGDALLALRAAGLAPAAVPLADADAAWVDELPFALPDGLHDAAAAALLAGARDPDLLGAAPSDAAVLAAVHGNPDTQAAHCLRSDHDDDPDGDVPALAACRAAILDEVDLALAATGDADDDPRESVTVWLAISGARAVPAPAAWWHLGRAAHTLADSYAHTFRDDALRVTAVLNFVDFADETLDPARDGAAHRPALDACAADGLPGDRAHAAAAATVRLLQAALEPGAAEAVRRAHAAAVVDEVLARTPGCDAGNDWCDAAELAVVPACATSPGGMGLLALGLAVGAAVRRRAAGTGRGVAVAVGMAGLLALSTPARAGEPGGAVDPGAFGVELRAGAAVDRLAAAVSVGPRWRLSGRTLLGLDAEFNPWMSELTGEVVPGSTNLMLVYTREYPMRGERLRLTFSVRGGLARLNMTVYGAAEGSVGPAFGLAALGLAVDLGRGLTLVLEPDDVEVPVPHLTGVPLAWVQYRMTAGLRWGAGVRQD